MNLSKSRVKSRFPTSIQLRKLLSEGSNWRLCLTCCQVHKILFHPLTCQFVDRVRRAPRGSAVDGHSLNDRDAKTRARRKARDGKEGKQGKSAGKFPLFVTCPPAPSHQHPPASFPVTKLPIPSGGKVRGEGSVHV